MMVSNSGSVIRLLFWQWRRVLLFTVIATLPVLLRREFPELAVTLPGLPVAIAGGALGIFVSFRTNSAYQRWWEGRILWGGLVNVSRHFADQVIAYLKESEAAHGQRLIRRHIAYVHVLRCSLRGQDPALDSDASVYLAEEEREFLGLSNPAHLLVQRQTADLAELRRAGLINEFELQSFDVSLRDVLNYQGGSERIKKTPLPRGYGFISDRLIVALGLLLPLSIVEEVGLLTIPLCVLVCLAFALISEAGRVLEDPFSTFFNGLPLYSISKTIEKNLLEALGERNLPPLPAVDQRGILM